jgi:flagellar protein FlbB
MALVTEKSKIIYLLILILFISLVGLFWLDYIGLVSINRFVAQYRSEPESVLNARGDEPSLLEREEFDKEKQRLAERIEDIDRREALLIEKEKSFELEMEKISETRKGIDLEKKKFDQEKTKHTGYKKNIKDLSQKISSMPPEEAAKIISAWEDSLIIDVLRQMDQDATDVGKTSISSYLITLMPKDKASRIMYLMTQL